MEVSTQLNLPISVTTPDCINMQSITTSNNEHNKGTLNIESSASVPASLSAEKIKTRVIEHQALQTNKAISADEAVGSLIDVRI